MVETQVLGNQKHKKYDPECNPDQTWNGGVAEKAAENSTAGMIKAIAYRAEPMRAIILHSNM